MSRGQTFAVILSIAVIFIVGGVWLFGGDSPEPTQQAQTGGEAVYFGQVAQIDAPAPLKNFGAQQYIIPLQNQVVTFTVAFETVGGSVVVTTDPVLGENIAIEVLGLSTGGEYIPGLAEPNKPFKFEKNGAGTVVFYVRAEDGSDTQFWVELLVPEVQP